MRITAAAAAVAFVFAASTAPAQPAGQEIEVHMSSYKFEPSTIHMRRNAPYVLVLRNTSHGGHSFEAREFFAATEAAADRGSFEGGKIEVPGGEEVRVAVTPTRAGTYPFHCTHPLHSAFGMTGSIVVD